MLLNVAFSELKMKKGKVVLTNRGSIPLSANTKANTVNEQVTTASYIYEKTS